MINHYENLQEKVPADAGAERPPAWRALGLVIGSAEIRGGRLPHRHLVLGNSLAMRTHGNRNSIP